jgi:hypothetical protein
MPEQSAPSALASAITLAFPQPDRLVRHAFGQLRVARFGDEDEKREQLGGMDPADLPRPWDPPTCSPALRKHVWVWLDRVAAWINHEYMWVYDRIIPSCWPAHAHVAHELAVVASLRYDAGFALAADTLEDWHRYTLPGFLDRMATRFGTSPCQPGKHNDWPAATRFKDFEAPASVERRGQAITNDQKYTAPPRTGRPPRTAEPVNGGKTPRSPQLTVISTGTPTEDGRDE